MFNRDQGQIRPQNIFITGASSGIGEALACAYATQDIVLNLIGRNEQRLSEVAMHCRERGAFVEAVTLNVADSAGLANAIKCADSIAPLDLVIANAGVGRSKEDSAFARELVNTNIVGTLNTVEPAIDIMTARGRGQIAIMSSLAAFRALGGPPGYAASKAWARLYGEALRGRLARRGVAVSVICPGFVATRMTEQAPTSGMPAEEAAEIIKAGLSRNAPRISFPKDLVSQTWWSSVLPTWWTDREIRRKWEAAGKD